MTFLALLFLTLALIVLVKGNLMNGFIKSLPNAKELESLNKDEQVKVILKGLFFILWWILHTIFWIAFLIKALTIDIYVFPTLVLIAIYIFTWVSFFIRKEHNKKLKSEFVSSELKDRTFWRTTESIIEIIYFSYIIWLLLF